MQAVPASAANPFPSSGCMALRLGTDVSRASIKSAIQFLLSYHGGASLSMAFCILGEFCQICPGFLQKTGHFCENQQRLGPIGPGLQHKLPALVGERNSAGKQHGGWGIIPGPIFVVPYQGKAPAGKLDPDLVAAAGVEADVDQALGAF